MTAVESRYFLRINGHPPLKPPRAESANLRRRHAPASSCLCSYGPTQHNGVSPIQFCNQSTARDEERRGERLIANRCCNASEDCREVWQVTSELRGQSRTDRWAGEVSFAYGRVHAFPHGR